MPWNLADQMRAVIRDDAIGCMMPDVENFVRVRELGGQKNHLGELEPYSRRVERVAFKGLETTGRGELDDRERNERVVGGQVQGEILLELLEDLLELGDRVERLADSEIANLEAGLSADLTNTTTAFEVVIVESPRLNNKVVSYQVTIREQTD